MKQIITAITLLTMSAPALAENDEKRAVNAIETVMMAKIKEKVGNPIKKAIIRKADKLTKKFKTEPTPQLKAIGAFLKVAKEILEPSLEVKTEDSKLKIKILEFKSLKLDYKNKNNDLNLNFETDLKTTTFGLKMSF